MASDATPAKFRSHSPFAAQDLMRSSFAMLFGSIYFVWFHSGSQPEIDVDALRNAGNRPYRSTRSYKASAPKSNGNCTCSSAYAAFEASLRPKVSTP